MKKISLFSIAIIVLFASACTKGDWLGDDYVGGRSAFYNSDGKSYMMNIADNIVTDALDELELALLVDNIGSQSGGHFITSGSIRTEGSKWTVKADDSMLNGMTITCNGENSWKMQFDGKYAFTSDTNYPTVFDINAVQIEGGWRITLGGSRTERGGYSCEFNTGSGTDVDYIDYLNIYGGDFKGWNFMKGELYMIVRKGDAVVDACCLVFSGNPGSSTYHRGL